MQDRQRQSPASGLVSGPAPIGRTSNRVDDLAEQDRQQPNPNTKRQKLQISLRRVFKRRLRLVIRST